MATPFLFYRCEALPKADAPRSLPSGYTWRLWAPDRGGMTPEGLSLMPFVYPLRIDDAGNFGYVEDRARALPVRWFARGEPYRLLGIVRLDRHLFGVDAPERVHLLGADALGRDVLSRLIYGGQVSLTVGLVGIAISVTLGLLLGGVSGYFGGWVDNLIMRFTELLLSIPHDLALLGANLGQGRPMAALPNHDDSNGLECVP